MAPETEQQGSLTRANDSWRCIGIFASLKEEHYEIYTYDRVSGDYSTWNRAKREILKRLVARPIAQRRDQAERGFAP